jgi:hypothetical protein
MSKVCRNILIWAVSIASVIPATALEAQVESKPLNWLTADLGGRG